MLVLRRRERLLLNPGEIMRLTTKGRFAVTAMADLAMRGGSGPVTLASIGERQSISQSYLEQLFGKLRRHGIVGAVRGPGGGYYLARPGEQITIAEIIAAVDGPLDATGYGGMANRHDGQQCLIHDLWEGLNDAINKYLSSVSLQQLADSQSNVRPDVMPVMLSKNMVRPVLAAV